MEYLKWMLLTFFLVGLFNTGLSKTTPSSEDYPENPQDDEEDYDDSSKNIEQPQIVQSNDVLGERPYFMEPSVTVNATIGEDVVLNCDAKNLRPESAFVIMWFNGTQLIATGSPVSANIIANKNKVKLHNWPTIKIYNVEYSDRNQYICSIAGYANLTIQLNVIKARSVAIYSSGRDLTDRSITFRQNDRVEFECRVIGLENPEIKWSLNGERATNHVSNINGGKVIIESIEAHQAGIYQCLGDDGSDNLPIGSVTINVQYTPKVSTHRHYVNTMPGDEAELYCDYKAEPIAITQWRNNHQEDIPTISEKYSVRSTIHERRNRTTLFIKNVTENDVGEYHCYVQNSLGSAQANVHLIFEPETPQLEDVVIDGKKANISWLVRSRQPIVEAAVDYKINEIHKNWMTASVTRSNPHGKHSGIWKLTHELELTPGKWHARMKVKNAYGWSKFSNERDILILDDIIESPPEDIIYASDIAGAKVGNSSNKIQMVPLLLLILCLISTTFKIVPLH